MALLVPTYYSPGWQCHQISPFHSSTLPSAKCQVPSQAASMAPHQPRTTAVCLSCFLVSMKYCHLQFDSASTFQIANLRFFVLKHKVSSTQTIRVLDLFFHFVKMSCRQTSKPKTPTQAENYLGPTIWFWRRLNHSYSACHIWEPRVWNIFSVNVSDDGSDDPLPVLRGPDIKGAWTWRLINID